MIRLSAKSFRFLIADESNLARQGLKTVLLKHMTNAVIIETDSTDSTLAAVKKQKFDLLLINYSLPDGDIYTLITTIISIDVTQKILIVSDYPVKLFAKILLKLGCAGYTTKSILGEELLLAVKKILIDKKQFISSEMIKSFMAESAIAPAEPNPFDKLSMRETQVITHFLMGKKSVEICEIMSLHVSTIRGHKATGFAKLNVTSVLELRKLADKHNLL